MGRKQERFTVKKVILKSLAIALLFSVGFSVLGVAQRNRQAASRPAPTLLSLLPPSDAVANINVARVFNEAMPKLLAESPAKLAELNADLEKFKTQTGLDPRSFDQLAVGFSYSYPREGVTKISSVALAHGTFNAGAMVAAGRLASQGKYKEEKYQGKTIYVFSLDRQMKVLGLLNITVNDLAATAIDGNTLALGNLESVRGVIDANRTRKHANPELLALATRDPNAIVGFGGNVSPLLLENLSLSNDSIARELTAVRQVYGTLGMSTTDLELMVAARTVDSASAKNLGDTVEGLKQLGGLFVGRLAAAKGTLAKAALNNLKITTLGNELQLKTAVAQSQVTPLMGGF